MVTTLKSCVCLGWPPAGFLCLRHTCFVCDQSGQKVPPHACREGLFRILSSCRGAAEVGVEGKRLNSQSAAERLWLEGRIAMVTAAFARLLPAACSSGPAALTGPKVSQEKRRCRDVLEHNCTSSILAGLRAAGPHWLASSLDQTSAVWTEPAGSVGADAWADLGRAGSCRSEPEPSDLCCTSVAC